MQYWQQLIWNVCPRGIFHGVLMWATITHI